MLSGTMIFFTMMTIVILSWLVVQF